MTDSGSPGAGTGRGAPGTGELRRRVIVAVIGVPLFVLVLYLGGWYLGALVALVAAQATRELFALASAVGVRPVGWLGVAASAGTALLAAHGPDFAEWGTRVLVLLLLVGLVSSGVLLRRSGEQPFLASVCATVVAPLYIGATLSFALLIRHIPEARGAPAELPWEGTMLVLLAFGVIWVGDSAAYFVGRAVGRRRLAPRVSPGKTVEGSVAGLVAATATGALMGLALQDLATAPVSPVAGAWMGLVLGGAAQFGDLAESLLKRDAGVKDSGTLLPGHGGMLDRFDAAFFTLPTAYALLQLARTLQ